MKTTSVLVILMYFLCAHSFGAVQGAPKLANDGIFATFGTLPLKSSEVILENRFAFLTTEIAERLGLTKKQMESYNRELDLLNAMMAEVSTELASMKRPTIDDAIGLWSGLKGAVSATTLEALRKITNGKKN